jgi:hypothetical protein
LLGFAALFIGFIFAPSFANIAKSSPIFFILASLYAFEYYVIRSLEGICSAR